MKSHAAFRLTYLHFLHWLLVKIRVKVKVKVMRISIANISQVVMDGTDIAIADK